MWTILIAAALVAVGIGLLTAGGEALVRGAVGLARLARLSPAVVGLTVVAAGTSMPELAVSLLAALEGSGDLAVGNVVGSNIFNVAVILGASALFIPLTVHLTAVKIEWPFMFATSMLCLLLARDGAVDRLEGGFFLVALVGFTGYMIRHARREITPAEAATLDESVSAVRVPTVGRRGALDAALVAVGVLLLVAGAQVLVRGAVQLAQLAGWSERVIGLTIVAAGTSAPELATSIVAARRGQPDIALANVLGSNVFNILGILGVVALITPQTVHPRIIGSDLWWMAATAAVLFPLMRSGFRITRWEGVLLLAAYAVYGFTLFR